ncbi:unnamed protein product [Oncorhynchus mykiss]|uniref:PH domain-containing protein n=1 Tax=Oncorhynchus mykiss TaxID=8022 RepID=A0A060Z3W7_ONCMY|nr:unnamed protein product [Oncorhynchus mykiss]
MKKISTAMNQEWDGKPLEDLLSQDASVQEEGMSVWVFLNHMGAGRLLRVSNAGAFSLALDQVFLEMYHNVLKRGYMWKKGHVRRNWMERWFVLRPSFMAYYTSEDLKDKKGEILLDQYCVVEGGSPLRPGSNLQGIPVNIAPGLNRCAFLFLLDPCEHEHTINNINTINKAGLIKTNTTLTSPPLNSI